MFDITAKISRVLNLLWSVLISIIKVVYRSSIDDNGDWGQPIMITFQNQLSSETDRT